MRRVVIGHTNPAGLSGQIHQVQRPEPGGYSVEINGPWKVSIFVSGSLLLPIRPEFVGECVVQEEFWGIG